MSCCSDESKRSSFNIPIYVYCNSYCIPKVMQVFSFTLQLSSLSIISRIWETNIGEQWKHNASYHMFPYLHSQPTCPADLHLENGSPCRAIGSGQTAGLSAIANRSELDDAQALCYQGRCPTRDSQCESVWGTGATRAADYCFMFHNTKTAGACGVSGENCKPP